jgi:hypothetical protein
MTEQERRDRNVKAMRHWQPDITPEQREKRLKDIDYIRRAFKEARYRVTGHDAYKFDVRPFRGSEYVVEFTRETTRDRTFSKSIHFDIEHDLRRCYVSRDVFFDYWISRIHYEYRMLTEGKE